MIYWIWLSKIKGVGIHSRHLLLSHLKEPKAIYDASIEQLLNVKGIGEGKAKVILETRSLELARKIWQECEQNHIHILTMNDSRYPKEVKRLSNMPTHFYYKGTIKENSVGIAIVGSRRCSSKGKQQAIEYATHLAKQSVCVFQFNNALFTLDKSITYRKCNAYISGM